jgi:hypothetical protein
VVVYVYRTDSDARAAYDNACPTRCIPKKIPSRLGIRAKYNPQPFVRTEGGITARCIAVISVRLNV